MHGSPDRLGTVDMKIEIQGSRQLAADVRQDRFDGIHHGYGVGARLAVDREGKRAGVAKPTAGLVVLDIVQHGSDVFQADGRAVAVGHHQGTESAGIG